MGYVGWVGYFVLMPLYVRPVCLQQEIQLRNWLRLMHRDGGKMGSVFDSIYDKVVHVNSKMLIGPKMSFLVTNIVVPVQNAVGHGSFFQSCASCSAC